ncbi:MAG: copper-binding protein [Rhodobacteraceae bacterium]|nr:copper-binding protein [Paracoccaceae bacterium]
MAAKAADKVALCVDAEERYVEIFGHPSVDEDGVEVVKMYRYNFCPAEITVPVGTTVRWVNVDKRTSHSVILPDEPESERAFPEEILEFTFLVAGDQAYLCGPHWETQKMMGMVRVNP